MRYPVRTRRTAAAVALGLTAVLLPAGLSGGEEPSEAATRQYAAAVALQNREAFDLAAEAWTEFIADFRRDAVTGRPDPRLDRAHHYLGVCYLKTGRFDEARRAFETLLADFAESDLVIASRLYLGIAQYSLGQAGEAKWFEPAAETFRQVVEAGDVRFLPEATFYRGEALYAQEKRAEATAYYRRFVERYPEDPLAADALYALGVAEEEQDRHEAAGAAYRQFLQRFPQHTLTTEVGMRLGETLFAAGDYSAAAARFSEAAEAADFALADHATIRQAAALAQMKRYEEAAAVYAAVPERFPESAHVDLAELAGGKCYYLAENHEAARALLARVLERGGEPAAEAAHWTARSYLDEDRPQEALAVVEEVLPAAAGSDHAAVLMMDRADAVYEIPERRAEAAGLYAEVAAAHGDDPVAPQAAYMAAYTALGEGDFAAALDHARQSLERYGDDPLAVEVQYVAAEAALQQEQFDEAARLYETLVSDYPDHADADVWRVRRGLVHFMKEEFAETAALLEPLIDELRSPEAVAEARFLVGSSAVELGKIDEAIASLAAALDAAPTWRQADDNLLALAGVLRRAGRVDEARQAIERLLSEFPASPVVDRAHYRLGEYSYAQGDLSTAEAAYQRALEATGEGPLAPYARYGLGWTALGREDFRAAEAHFAELLDRHPDHGLKARAHYGRGMARQQLGEYAAAAEDLTTALAGDLSATERSDARYVLGLAKAGLGEYAEAAAAFTALLEDDVEYGAADRVLYELAWAQKAAGRDAEAAQTFTRLAREHEESALAAEAWYHVAEDAYDREDYRRSAVGYHRAMQRAGQDELAERATHKLGWAYYHQGDFERAQQTFHFQRATYPQGPLAADALFMQAECLFQQQRYAEALAIYEQVQEASTDEFRVLALLHGGQAAAQLEQWEESLDLLTRASASFPESPYLPEVLYEQGWALHRLGRTDEALAAYREVIAQTGREVAARAQFMIGELLFENQDYAEAVKAFFQVVYGYSFPEWQANAAFEAARCFEAMQRPAQAIQQYRELIDKFPESDKAGLARQRIERLGG